MAPGLVHGAKIAPLSRHEWLLLIHVGGAFSVLAGALLACGMAVLAILVLMIWRPGA